MPDKSTGSTPEPRDEARARRLAQTVAGGPAQRPGERRTVQFVLECGCPSSGNPESLRRIAPFPIWVYWPGMPGGTVCGAPMAYEVTLESQRDVERAMGSRPESPGRGVVCDHMGSLIE